jgi:hypothetical protein
MNAPQCIHRSNQKKKKQKHAKLFDIDETMEANTIFQKGIKMFIGSLI